MPFVNALVEDAMQFLVLHEFAHILLGHDRGEVRLLRNRMVDLQIATFSIGQEHQADRLAARLHASMRRTSAEGYPGMEFVGPTLLFGLLGLLRDTRDIKRLLTPRIRIRTRMRGYTVFASNSRPGARICTGLYRKEKNLGLLD
jgi:hypothetical protein